MANNGLNRNVGKILCKGSGLKAYLEMTLSRPKNGEKLGDFEYKTFRYEIGTLMSLQTAISRQTSLNYVAGSSIPKSVNKGIRTTYGQIVFSQLDTSIVYSLLKDVKKWNYDTKQLEYANLDDYSLNDFSLSDPAQALVGAPEENLTIEYFKDDTYHLDNLPPVDLIVVGSADNIDASTGVYEINNTYMFKAKKLTFLSDTFGISAGKALHDVSTQVLILGGIEPWHKIN